MANVSRLRNLLKSAATIPVAYPLIPRRAQELAEQLNSLGRGDTFTFDDLEISVYMEVGPSTRRSSPEIEFQLSVSLEQQYLNSRKGVAV